MQTEKKDEARWTNFRVTVFGFQDIITKNYVVLQVDNSMSESDRWGVSNNTSKMVLSIKRFGSFSIRSCFDFGFHEISQFISRYNSAISSVKGINKLYDLGYTFQIVKVLPKKKLDIIFTFTKTTDGARCKVEIIDPVNSSAPRVHAYLTPLQIDNVYNLFSEMKKNYLSISSNYVNICNQNRIENNLKKVAQEITSKFEEITVRSSSIITDSISQISLNLQKSLTELVLNQVEDLKELINSKSLTDSTSVSPENSYLTTDDTINIIDVEDDYYDYSQESYSDLTDNYDGFPQEENKSDVSEVSEVVDNSDETSNIMEDNAQSYDDELLKEINNNVVVLPTDSSSEASNGLTEVVNNDISDEELSNSMPNTTSSTDTATTNDSTKSNTISSAQEVFDSKVENEVSKIELKSLTEFIKRNNEKYKSRKIKPLDLDDFYKDNPELDKHINGVTSSTGNLFIDNYLKNDINRISEIKTAYDFMEPNSRNGLFTPYLEFMKLSQVPYDQIEYLQKDPNFNFAQYLSILMYKRFVYFYFGKDVNMKFLPSIKYVPNLNTQITKEKHPELFDMMVGMIYTMSVYSHPYLKIYQILQSKLNNNKQEIIKYICKNATIAHYYLNLQYMKCFFYPLARTIRENTSMDMILDELVRIHKNSLESGTLKNLVVRLKKLFEKLTFDYSLPQFLDTVKRIVLVVYGSENLLITPDKLSDVFKTFSIPKDKYAKYNTVEEIRYSIMDVQEVANEIDDKFLPPDIKELRKKQTFKKVDSNADTNGKKQINEIDFSNKEIVAEDSNKKEEDNIEQKPDKSDLIYGKSKKEALRLYLKVAERFISNEDKILFERMKTDVNDFNQIVSFLNNHFSFHEKLWRLKHGLDYLMMTKKDDLNEENLIKHMNEYNDRTFYDIQLGVNAQDKSWQTFDQEETDRLGLYLDMFVLKEKFFTAEDD